ncbi:bifunctional UDP-N-acetylglucosamine diphosphorylase/glucosamine-1-phosphate N-acetyltransferase GlmU [Terasakiella sp. A23]|uniref:bifunctional UDP-N-acetylglucosamine diphosphorylase/glucosamine-1-phosphate N-acetyltransferase GlmU n=1 Tax=Terasakiella sp. FCG-A23 TaxID=3080561 RepID=UPI0029538B58|nr:bifunctional UDP-N-acetylglucosamine diphosphorylase/glucosamine-1-phosphate N-acetyltransferase GlmU [Terasakiella sp. A23]MDV7338335.1 bifunctional UDP-N-acetylglucosamine diphosphorylase/glucosamine-1-phosphate N-acetyltransferase GlmU [Terasakiella sp. A23]
MTMSNSAAIILAAGLGTRMKSSMPKVMHPLAGRPMVNHVIANLQEAGVSEITCVIGPDMPALEKTVEPHKTALQVDRLGTGHAVLAAKKVMDRFKGSVLIAFGDTPMISPDTFSRMLKANETADVVVLGFRPDDPAAYGRLVVEEGQLQAIVEYKDASDVERAINLCNSGVMCLNGEKLFGLLEKITNDNAAGEYYLTDIVALARAENLACVVVEGDENELLGVNSRVELAKAEGLVQDQLRHKAMVNGATLMDPTSTHFSYDTVLGQDVVVEPNVFFGPGVTVGDNVHIKAFSHLEDTSVGNKVVIGPYARLRPGAELKDKVKVGNFVEIKKALIEEGAKVNHLTYIGDARVGPEANIGAGTITCNYDGFFKYHTDIGAGAFIGSNTALVAPVKIGDGANIGAGSTISKDVADGDLGLTRAPQKSYAGWAEKFRSTQAAEKAKK